jgi:hypothetical protein
MCLPQHTHTHTHTHTHPSWHELPPSFGNCNQLSFQWQLSPDLLTLLFLKKIILKHCWSLVSTPGFILSSGLHWKLVLQSPSCHAVCLWSHDINVFKISTKAAGNAGGKGFPFLYCPALGSQEGRCSGLSIHTSRHYLRASLPGGRPESGIH